jgi:acetyl esterase
MPLDPQARLVIDNLPPGLLDVRSKAPADLRALYEGQTTIFPGEPVARVENRRIPGPAGEIPVRIYTPKSDDPRPAIVFFHGGGWVIGNLETHDGTARKLANAAGCSVVSVDYRLAPEHRFPAAAEDCFAALAWTADNAGELGVRADALAVAGDSAGGNLAAVTALMARERGGPGLRFQLLVYPVTSPDFDTPSYLENAEGYLLTRDAMRWFWEQYAPEPAHRSHPFAAPLAAPDLAGLPPALVITAEYDPLRDEGEAYARRMAAAGVPVTASRYDGVIHGFFSFSDFMEKGKSAVEEAATALRTALHA